jgi:hypothetical protein
MKVAERSQTGHRKNATQATLICYYFKERAVKTVTVYHCDDHSQHELIFVFHPERNGKLKGYVTQTRPANVWEGRLGCMACHRRQLEPFLWDLGREHRWSWNSVERSYAVWAAKNKVTPTLSDDDGLGIPETVKDFSHLTPAQLPRHLERPLPDDDEP